MNWLPLAAAVIDLLKVLFVTATGKKALSDLLRAQADELADAEAIKERAIADLRRLDPERLRADDGFRRDRRGEARN